MSVLSHLALRFSTQTENLATEALAHILGRSASASTAMRRFVLETTGRDLDLHRFETQAANLDRSRPDLVGVSSSGVKLLAVEMKFWAGLTEAQPNGYLASLPEPGVVMFVAPAARLHTLWPELVRRVNEISPAIDRPPPWREGAMTMDVAGSVLAAVSWRDLLRALQGDVEAAGEADTAADIRQVAALCERMDTDAFLPLTSEEMTGTIGKRIIQFVALASDLTNDLVQQGLADVRGLRATSGPAGQGRNLNLRGYGAFLHFGPSKWAQWGQSPLWISIASSPFDDPAATRQAFRAAGLLVHEDPKNFHIAITLPIGVEQDAVIAAARSQLVAIAAALPGPGADDGAEQDVRRSWWQPILDMRFEDPNQEPPKLFHDHVRVPLPWPRTWLYAASPEAQKQCGVWFASSDQDGSLQPLLMEASDQLLSKLPEGTTAQQDGAGSLSFGLRRDWDSFDGEDAKRAWLAETIRAFRAVFNPYLVKMSADQDATEGADLAPTVIGEP